MTKHEYLEQLRKELRRLPKEEVERAVNYYEEYFDEAGEENFESTAEELGPPASIAPQILKDAAILSIKEPAKSVKSSAQAVWMVILAIFAAPIGLPIGFALVVTIGALAVAVLAVIAAVVLAFVVMIASGVVTIATSLVFVFTNGVEGIMPLGAGMAAMGTGIIGLYLIVVCGKWILLGIARLFQRRITGRNAK